jgi:hypothetical protein
LFDIRYSVVSRRVIAQRLATCPGVLAGLKRLRSDEFVVLDDFF